jgi:hypothetical protein
VAVVEHLAAMTWRFCVANRRRFVNATETFLCHCVLESGVTTCKGYTIRTANVYSTFTLFIDFHHTFITYTYDTI